MSDATLAGRTALVTGGESGIGAACVEALAAAGADVAILFHRKEDKAAEVCAKVRELGRRAAAFKADVGIEADVEAGFDQVAEALGRPDILVNSAGINMEQTHVADTELAEWSKRIAADLTGSWLTSRRFVRNLRAAKQGGAIINITSIHDEAMRAGGAAYNAAKAGQLALTRSMAMETAELGITVNAVAPGMILTPMNKEAIEDEAKLRDAEEDIPMKRAGKPEDVAAAVLFLASPAADYITGARIVVDGGLSLMMGQGA